MKSDAQTSQAPNISAASFHIGIIGTGVIGSLFTYYIDKYISKNINKDEQQHLISVSFFVRKIIDNQHTLNVNTLDNQLHQLNYPSIEMTDTNFQDLDLLIIPIKCYQVKDVVDTIKQTLSTRTVICLLQNGMGGAACIQDALPENPLLIATTTDAGYKTNTYTCQQTAIGRLDVGSVSNKCDLSTDTAIKMMTNIHPHAVVHQHIEKALHEKLAVNAIINPMCAVKDIRNGALLGYLADVNALFEEVWLVLARLSQAQNQWSLNKTELLDKIIQVIKDTANNSCSMREDIKHHRKTEIDGILGYLLENAAEYDTPLINSYFDKVLLLESTYPH